MFQLPPHEAHVWCASLEVSPQTHARHYANLCAEERSRSLLLRYQHDRQRFIVARGVLRELLGRYLQTEPRQIRFVYNAFGKPDLGPEFANRLKFNLSHSAGVALIAIAAADVGVDLEYIRAQPDHADVARHFFSPAEFDALRALPSHRHAEAFFSCWTKKEAYLKARGEGLALPLNGFSVPLTADPAQAPVDVHGWSLHTLRPAPGFAGALAIGGAGWRLREWQWTMPQGVARGSVMPS
jgi:4'-phosphopantetheinyl transferase